MAYRIPLVTQSNAIHSPFSIALTHLLHIAMTMMLQRLLWLQPISSSHCSQISR